MRRYKEFNIFETLTLPKHIGDFYLLMKKTPLTRLVQLECCGGFVIYGRLELILF